jgi:hypothetical protein
MFYLTPPRHISTLPKATEMDCPLHVRLAPDSDRNNGHRGALTGYPSAGNSRRSRRLAASNRLAHLEPLELWVIKIQRFVVSCATMRCAERL